LFHQLSPLREVFLQYRMCAGSELERSIKHLSFCS
jgi:hypothetical protein